MNISEDKPEKSEQSVSPQQTVAEIIIQHPQLRIVLEDLGIDYCCGGKNPLTDAVKAARLDLNAVLATLEQALQQEASTTSTTDWTKVSLTALANHILDTHHVYTKKALVRIDTLLSKVQTAHSEHHGQMLNSLRTAFEPLREELEAHLMKEEEILFPAIIGIDGFVSGIQERPFIHCGSVSNPIGQMEHEHDNAGRILAEMREITNGYQPPADACPTFTALYEALESLEEDLHEHIHLENNILFPASQTQEQQMNT